MQRVGGYYTGPTYLYESLSTILGSTVYHVSVAVSLSLAFGHCKTVKMGIASIIESVDFLDDVRRMNARQVS